MEYAYLAVNHPKVANVIDEILCANLGIDKDFLHAVFYAIDIFMGDNSGLKVVKVPIDGKKKTLDISRQMCYSVIVRAKNVSFPPLEDAWEDRSNGMETVSFSSYYIPGEVVRRLYLARAVDFLITQGEHQNVVETNEQGDTGAVTG